MRPVLALLLLAATFSCGGAEFTLAPSAGDAGGATDATAPSDSAPPDDAASPDSGTTDASLHDAGDASPDATQPDDGGPPVFTTCANALATETTVVFCSDFDLDDGDSGPPWNWTPPALATSKGANADDAVDFVSPPYGYAATTQVLLPTDSANFATLSQPFTTAKPHLTYAFDVYVKTLGLTAAGSFPIAQIIVGGATTERLFVNLVLGASGLSLQQQATESDGGSTSLTTAVGGMLGASWSHVEIDLDRNVTPAVVSVLLGGALKGTSSTIAPATSNALQVGLGILIVVPPSGANAVTFDNAIVHAHD
jgi:hypothetical protein